MTTQTALNTYLAGRHQRANAGAARVLAEARAEADKIISNGRAQAYQMIREAGQEEAQIVAALQAKIVELKTEQKSLRRQNANIKTGTERAEANMAARVERKAETLSRRATNAAAKIKLDARKQAKKIVDKARTDARERLAKIAEAKNHGDLAALMTEAQLLLVEAEKDAALIREKARTAGLALADAEKLTVSIPDREAARARLQAVTNEATGRYKLKDAS